VVLGLDMGFLGGKQEKKYCWAIKIIESAILGE
jgi:hypothetical protein